MTPMRRMPPRLGCAAVVWTAGLAAAAAVGGAVGAEVAAGFAADAAVGCGAASGAGGVVVGAGGAAAGPHAMSAAPAPSMIMRRIWRRGSAGPPTAELTIIRHLDRKTGAGRVGKQ